MSWVPVTTHQLYVSQKNVELVCGFYGMNHPKCKMALEKDDELYANFILQFDISRRHVLEQKTTTTHPARQEMGLRSGGSRRNPNDSISDTFYDMEEEEE